MAQNELMNWLAALGWPGALAWIVYLLVTKTTIFQREEPQRSDVLQEVRNISAEMKSMRNEMTDRLARIETRQQATDSRLDRMS